MSTSKGQESALAHVAIVDNRGKVIYNEHVAQSKRVIDYRTKYSGVKKSDLEGGLLISLCRSI